MAPRRSFNACSYVTLFPVWAGSAKRARSSSWVQIEDSIPKRRPSAGRMGVRSRTQRRYCLENSASTAEKNSTTVSDRAPLCRASATTASRLSSSPGPWNEFHTGTIARSSRVKSNSPSKTRLESADASGALGRASANATRTRFPGRERRSPAKMALPMHGARSSKAGRRSAGMNPMKVR
eukprot:scaffold1932_cov163-Pinguiococcus_pyrenoidosus.AAC.2